MSEGKPSTFVVVQGGVNEYGLTDRPFFSSHLGPFFHRRSQDTGSGVPSIAALARTPQRRYHLEKPLLETRLLGATDPGGRRLGLGPLSLCRPEPGPACVGLAAKTFGSTR